MNESINFSEDFKLDLHGKTLNFNPSESKMYGELDINVYDKSGRCIAKKKTHNEVILSGAVYVLEQLFKTKAGDRRLHPVSVNTNSSYGSVAFASSWSEPTSINDEVIFGFMMGNGGSDANGTSKVKFNNNALTNQAGAASFIPFQIVSTSITQPAGYYMRAISNGEYLYFAKAFTDEPAIVVTDNGAYVRMHISVTADDFRAYFTAANAGVVNGVNQIGLVAGQKNTANNQYDDIKLITTANFGTIDLSGDTYFDIEYKLWCL